MAASDSDTDIQAAQRAGGQPAGPAKRAAAPSPAPKGKGEHPISPIAHDDALSLTRRFETSAYNTFALSDEPPMLASGQGACVYGEDGRRYLDLVCGSCVSNLGHDHPRQRAALHAAIDTGLYHVGTRLAARARADLYRELAALFPAELDTVHLMTTGSDAIETAIKAARYVTGRHQVLGFHGSFHGRTLGTLALTSQRSARAPFEPLDAGVHLLPYPYALRPPLPGCDATNITDACLDYLRRALKSPVSGLHHPAALVVEAIQGVGGVVKPADGFLEGLRAICTECDIVMVLDEVWNGFGRAGSWFAYELDGIRPDLVTVSKGLSAGLPLSACIGTSSLLKAWPHGLQTGTWQGNVLACALACETIRSYRDEGLIARVADVIGPQLQRRLQVLHGQAHVAEVRVHGAQAAIELVEDRASLTPDVRRLKAVQRRCQERGVLTYSGGWYGNCLILLPPFVIGADELDEALDIVIEAVTHL